MDDQERLVREHISENPLPILSEHFFMESVANPHYTILSMSSIEHIIYTHYTNLSIESSYLHPI
jgi:O-acetylhomoserine/O-acetylserine sulfhydrylase-like pyridoxal-dependent enzyme